MKSQIANTKTVLITGASSGFGKVMAIALLNSGYRVFGTSRQMKSSTDGIEMLQLDVTDETSVHHCIEQVLKASGRIDVVINNAGIGLCGAIEDTTIDEAQTQLDTNFWGVVRMTRLIIPIMRSQQTGRIITIGSLAGHVGLPFQAYYSASKFALEGFNEALRLELTDSGVDSTIICPGDYKTGFTAARIFSGQATSGVNSTRLSEILKIYERDELNGADPEQLGSLVVKIVRAEKTKVRYFTGNIDQLAGVMFKRWFPSRWFESLMRSTYKL